MSDDRESTELSPISDSDTEVVPPAAGAEPLAWSSPETGSQPVAEYQEEPRWRGLLPKIMAPAAAVAIGAVAVILLTPNHHQAAPAPQSVPKVAPAPLPTIARPTVAPTLTVAAPATPAVTATDVSTALTARGRAAGPFEACYFLRDENGYPPSDPERPNSLGLVGWHQQWTSITNKLAALGINIKTTTEGVVSSVTFANTEAKRAWDNWWAVAKYTVN